MIIKDKTYKTITIIFCIILFVCTFLNIFTIRVTGISMVPILEDRGWYMTRYVKTEDIKKGDIVIFKKDDIKMVKLAMGVEGDKYCKVTTPRGTYHYINKQPLLDTYPAYRKTFTRERIVDEIMIGNNELFVLGANHANSTDSRVFGIVKLGNITRLVRSDI